jgi:hypothetical protein
MCERFIQRGKKDCSETIVTVCDDCRRQSHFEAKRHQARQLGKNQQESGESAEIGHVVVQMDGGAAP